MIGTSACDVTVAMRSPSRQTAVSVAVLSREVVDAHSKDPARRAPTVPPARSSVTEPSRPMRHTELRTGSRPATTRMSSAPASRTASTWSPGGVMATSSTTRRLVSTDRSATISTMAPLAARAGTPGMTSIHAGSVRSRTMVVSAVSGSTDRTIWRRWSRDSRLMSGSPPAGQATVAR